MKRIIQLTFLFLLCTINNSAQVSYLGLGHLKTSDLTILNENIYASTNDGIFKKDINSLDTVWTPCGMQGVYVIQTLVKDSATFISVIQDGVTKYLNIKKTTDGGNSFSVLLSSEKEFRGALFLDHLAHPNNNYDTIYSLFHRMKTFDGGITWTPITEYLGISFVKVHPDFDNQIFTGGENFAFIAELKYSTDFGNSFKRIDMRSFFAGDNAVYDIEFVGNRWICVGEGVIAYTDDNGDNWTQVWNSRSDKSVFSMYIFDIEKSTNGQLYASGAQYAGINTKNRIGLLSSSTNGQTWDTISFPSFNDNNPEIKCIALNSANGTDNIFFGGNGIYLYSKNISGISSPLADEPNIKIFPNPSQDGIFNILMDNTANEELISCTAINLLGHKINASWNNQYQISIKEKGVFFLRIQSTKEVFYGKVINNKNE